MTDTSKKELFSSVPVPKALATMAVPTVISQLVNLVYNMVDAFFIGRTGNSYMMAATTVALTLMMLNVAFSNLFGIGGGSLVARLMGKGADHEAKSVSAFSFYGAAATAILYSSLFALFSEPVLRFLGASDATVGFAKEYTFFVIIIGTLPTLVALTLAQLLRNAGYSTSASVGLCIGGVLNMALDPLFMFVILKPGNEVKGAAIATLLSNTIGCLYLLFSYVRATRKSPLSLSLKRAAKISRENVKILFAVGVPSAILTGLFDLASICVNKLASAHNDQVLAAMGIVMKVERIPNAVNIGLCQGMLPIVAFNYSAGNRERMKKTINAARICGLAVSALSILLLELFAVPVTRVFLDTGSSDPETALLTVSLAAAYLRVRCLAAPVQFINYHTSFCMQAMGKGKETMIHAVVRELVFYIPLMILLDRLFGDIGLASALPAGEALGAVFALVLFRYILKKRKEEGMKNKEKKKNPILKVLKAILILLLVIVLLFAALIVYLSVTEYRPAEREVIEVKGTAETSPAEGDKIKLVSWNVGYCALGETADFFMDGGKMVYTAAKDEVVANEKAVVSFVSEQDPDLILFQETDVSSDRTYKIDETDYIRSAFPEYSSTFAYNFNVSFLPYPIPPIGQVGSGLLTLSRYKIDSAERVSLPNPFSWPVRMVNLKRCLDVNRIPIDGSDRELVLINLHLEAYDSGEGKTAQTAMLRDFLNEEAKLGNYVIAGGDFNQIFSSEDQSLFPFDPELWVPGVLEVGEFGEGWQFLMDERVPSCRSLDKPYKDADKDSFQYYLIDGFIISDNITVESYETVSLGFVNSDHNPVVLEITLGK